MPMQPNTHPKRRNVYCARRAQQLFTPAEQAGVQAFLTDVRARLSLSRKHTELMLDDHLSRYRALR